MREPLDVSLGGSLSHEVVKVLNARIVCTAANNQLAHDGIEKRLAERDIAYAPDYCVNSGRVPLSQGDFSRSLQHPLRRGADDRAADEVKVNRHRKRFGFRAVSAC